LAKTSKRKCTVCKKSFTPTNDTPTVQQQLCSNGCCIKKWKHLNTRSKKIARALAGQVGKRSMGEVIFEHEYLTGIKPIVEYERDTFEYKVEETHTYTPDFTVELARPTKKTKGKVFYIEYKGVLDRPTRKKMLLIKKQYPTLDIRIVFQRGKNKIYKGSKTTYMDWANKHGFPCADNEVPKSWLKIR